MQKKRNAIFIKILLILLGIGFLFPLYWMLMMSFKNHLEITVNPFGLPKEWVFTNYAKALEKMRFLPALKNSLIYTTGTCLLALTLGAMAAYAISRMGWKYENHARTVFMMGLVIPMQLVMIPLYTIVHKLGLKNSALGVILPYTAFQLPSTILMFYAFLRGIPKELEEAARIDGCNVYQCFLRIILPTLKPALATRFVLIFMNIWNEYNLALILANTSSKTPLTIELNKFFVTLVGSPNWGYIGAAMILSSLPAIIVYTFGNRQIENALTVGAILK